MFLLNKQQGVVNTAYNSDIFKKIYFSYNSLFFRPACVQVKMIFNCIEMTFRNRHMKTRVNWSKAKCLTYINEFHYESFRIQLELERQHYDPQHTCSAVAIIHFIVLQRSKIEPSKNIESTPWINACERAPLWQNQLIYMYAYVWPHTYDDSMFYIEST